MQLPKTAKNRNLETVRIRVLPPVLLAPLRRPSPAPLRRPATARIEMSVVFDVPAVLRITTNTAIKSAHTMARATKCRVGGTLSGLSFDGSMHVRVRLTSIGVR
ncbi:hypothetical protein C6Q28_26855 [Burkholderia multivorans]|nr:hypothetical protein C6Q28_26855 [Burkholderia multivorans]